MKTMVGDGELAVKRTVARDVLRVVLAAGLVLLVPLLAMQFTNEVAWDLIDFAVAGALLAGTGLAYVLVTRKLAQRRHRIVIGFALTVAFILAWMELAVGIFGTPLAGS